MPVLSRDCGSCSGQPPPAAAGLQRWSGGIVKRKSVRKHFTKDTDTKEIAHGHDDNGPQAVEGSVTQRMD